LGATGVFVREGLEKAEMGKHCQLAVIPVAAAEPAEDFSAAAGEKNVEPADK